MRHVTAVAFMLLAVASGSGAAQTSGDRNPPPVSSKSLDSPLFRVQTGAPRAGSAADTVRPRQRAVVLSDAYATRLTIHRYTAYAILPLFAYQYFVGQKLYDGVQSSQGEADWVRPAHRAGAYTIAGAFAVNTVTGAWNLWETRAQSEGRPARLLHAGSMTAALGGFTYAGVKLSDEAKTSFDKRRQHRTVALGSMGLTLVSGTLMWLSNR